MDLKQSLDKSTCIFCLRMPSDFDTVLFCQKNYNLNGQQVLFGKLASSNLVIKFFDSFNQNQDQMTKKKIISNHFMAGITLIKKSVISLRKLRAFTVKDIKYQMKKDRYTRFFWKKFHTSKLDTITTIFLRIAPYRKCFSWIFNFFALVEISHITPDFNKNHSKKLCLN